MIVVDCDNSKNLGSRKIYLDGETIWLSSDGVNDISNIDEYIMPCSNETGQQCGWYLLDDQIMNIRNRFHEQNYEKYRSDFPLYKFPDYLKIKLDWEETPNEIILKRRLYEHEDDNTNYSDYNYGPLYDFVSFSGKELYETEDGRKFLKKIKNRIADVFYEFQNWKNLEQFYPVDSNYPGDDTSYLDFKFYFGGFSYYRLRINKYIFWKIHLHSIKKDHEISGKGRGGWFKYVLFKRSRRR